MSTDASDSPRTDDLFESSNMSFGEHLEELREVLIRAFIGVVVGFLVGMFLADDVVHFVERPLRNGLDNFFLTKDVQAIRSKMAANGETLSKADEAKIRQRRLTYDTVYLERDELDRLAGEYRDNQAQDNILGVNEAPTSAGGAMLRLRIWKPLASRITALSAQEGFMIWVKAGLVSGVIVASPYIFFQIWSFVAAGLYPHERSYVYTYLPFSLGLFLSGAALAFFFVFDPVLDFLFGFNHWMGIDPDPRISEWISFVLLLPLGFGAAFQLPLVMLLLNRLGVLSVETYLSQWRMAILVIFFLSMILTPADPISMLLMAVPLSGLYFLGVGLCYWAPTGRRNPYPKTEDAA